MLAWKKWAVLAASVCLILGINYVWNDANVESNEYNDMNESHDKPESMESNKEENKEENQEKPKSEFLVYYNQSFNKGTKYMILLHGC